MLLYNFGCPTFQPPGPKSGSAEDARGPLRALTAVFREARRRPRSLDLGRSPSRPRPTDLDHRSPRREGPLRHFRSERMEDLDRRLGRVWPISAAYSCITLCDRSFCERSSALRTGRSVSISASVSSAYRCRASALCRSSARSLWLEVAKQPPRPQTARRRGKTPATL